MSLINYENVEKFKILYILTHPTVEVQQWAYMFIVHGVVNQIGSSTCLELFVVHGLRLFAVSEHFWWFLNLYKNLDCKSTEIIPPNNSKGKMYNSYVHNASHSSRKFPVRHSILPPKIKQRQFALASVLILLLWFLPLQPSSTVNFITNLLI